MLPVVFLVKIFFDDMFDVLLSLMPASFGRHNPSTGKHAHNLMKKGMCG